MSTFFLFKIKRKSNAIIKKIEYIQYPSKKEKDKLNHFFSIHNYNKPEIVQNISKKTNDFEVDMIENNNLYLLPIIIHTPKYKMKNKKWLLNISLVLKNNSIYKYKNINANENEIKDECIKIWKINEKNIISINIIKINQDNICLIKLNNRKDMIILKNDSNINNKKEFYWRNFFLPIPYEIDLENIHLFNLDVYNSYKFKLDHEHNVLLKQVILAI
jgi:hypothetical protein